jgi:hypothetical protein
VYNILVGKYEAKSPLGTPRHRLENNIEMDLKEIGWMDVDWCNVAQERGPMLSSCEHYNGPFVSIKGGIFP